MRNFTDAQNALVTAIGSANSAWEENARYMESIEAHQNKLKAEWEKLVLSAPIEDLEKSLLNAATAILEFANSGVGQAIIKVTLWTTAIMGLIVAFSKLGTVIAATTMGAAVMQAIEAIAVYKDLTLAVSLLTDAMKVNPLFLGATLAIAGTVALVALVDKLTVSFEEATEALEKSTKALNDSQNTINSLESDLKNLQQTIADLENQKLKITDDDELNKLNQQTQQLKHQEALLKSQLTLEQQKLKALQDEAKLNADKLFNSQNKGYTETSYNKYDFAGGTKSAYDVGTKETASGGVDEALNQQITNIENLNQRIQTLSDSLEVLRQNGEENSQLALNYADEINYLNALLIEEEKSMNANAEAMINAEGAGYKFSKSQQEIFDRYNALNDSSDDVKNSLEEIEQSEEEASDAISAFLSTADDLQSAYETLNKAAEEYNQTGYISAATLKKLAKLPPEFQAQLENLNGTMIVSNGALQDQFEISKKLAIIHAKTETETEALAYAQNYLADNIEQAGKDSQESIPKVSELAQAYTDLGNATQAANKGIWEVRNALGDDTAEREAFEEALNGIYEKGEKRVKTLEGIELDYVSSSKDKASSHKDAWVEAFEEEQRQLKHSLEMNEITELEYYERLKDLNEKYFGEISGKHQKYIKEYQENEEEIYKGTKAVYDKVKDYLKEAVENGYEKAINALEKEEKKVLDEIKKQIDALKKEKSSVLDGIKDEIDALKRQKDAVQDYYNKQIDVIKKENDVLQEQNELLEYQQALQQAKAQKVMVMQDGKFQLGENESAVAQAEQNLSNYQDQLSYEQQIQQLEYLRDAQVESIEARIASLEEYYDYMEDYYDKQIESMELYYDQVQEQYELQIEALQAELDAFKEGYQKSEDLENAKLAASVLAANEEAAVWQTRLENLANAVTEYNKLLSMIGEEGAVASSGFKFSEASYNPSSSVGGIDSNIQTRASGDASFKNDEIALVGESPNTELVLGSRLNKSVNSGVLTHLSKGSGVVNAESTQTLAGLLNGLANPTNVSNARSTQQTFNFGAITLPNVTNAESFVGALRDKFNNYSIQYSTIKK